MADIQSIKVSIVDDASVERTGLALYQDSAPKCKSTNFPEITLECKFTDSQNPNIVLADFTGKNAIKIPQAINDLSPREKRALLLVIKDFFVENLKRRVNGEEPLDTL